MNKIFISLMAAAAFASCSQNGNSDKAESNANAESQEATVVTEVAKSPIEEFESRIKELDKKLKRRGANKDSLQAVKDAYIREICESHCGDSLGLLITKDMAVDFDVKQMDSVMHICDLYANDSTLKQMVKLAAAAEATGVGKHYIDIKGINVKNDRNGFTLSSVVAQGKPVLVNFWGSWNIPSRDVIRVQISELKNKYAGKVNFCSVAVWEDSITYVHRATDEMMIDWANIYTEGRKNSPIDAYGVHSIPFVMLIGSNGIIKARNIEPEAIEAVLEKEIGK